MMHLYVVLLYFNILGEACVISGKRKKKKTHAGWITVTLSQNLPGEWIIMDLTLIQKEQ